MTGREAMTTWITAKCAVCEAPFERPQTKAWNPRKTCSDTCRFILVGRSNAETRETYRVFRVNHGR